MAMDGRITDGVSIIGLTRAALLSSLKAVSGSPVFRLGIILAKVTLVASRHHTCGKEASTTQPP